MLEIAVRLCDRAALRQLMTFVWIPTRWARNLHAGSKKGQEILSSWAASLKKFKQLVPPSEAGTPEASPEAEKATNGAGAVQSAEPVATAA